VDKNPVPYKKAVFVCCNVREGGRVACANPGRGGDDILKALKEGVKHAGLKKQIRVARSGCLDLCEKGPNLFVFPDGEWYSGVTESDVPALLQKLVTP
jgi:(2Fe-2S) ferredoxin